MTARDYRSGEGRALTPAELQKYLAYFADPANRAALAADQEAENGDDRFFWHWMFNLKRNCDHLSVPVPEWLDSMLASAPPEPVDPPAVFGTGG